MTEHDAHKGQFPILVWVYVRLAYAEEREAENRFGEQWREYADRTPRFVPRPCAT